MKREEYDEMIRKRPSLKPTEAIKAQNTHEALRNITVGVQTVIERGPYEFGEPNGGEVTVIQETCVKSPRTLKFTVLGQPVGKPRQTQSDRWKKRPCVMRYRAWADKARASVPKGVSLGVYRQIHFIAYLEMPKSYSMTRRHILAGNPHHQKPDLDNILKSLSDSLFPEDKFIWKFSGEKIWDDGKGPRIEVKLR